MTPAEYLVGVDIGGTCTDCVVVDQEGRVTLAKAFSTPPDFSGGIFDALDVAAEELGRTRAELLADTRLFLHSTTVAENAVVDGTLARAGVITNRGFEDNLFAMRGGYGRWSGLTEEEKRNPIETDKLPPIVPRELVAGVRERTDARGGVRVEPDDGDIERAARGLLDAGVEAVGVSTLWSFVNAETERRIGELVRRLRPDLFLTLSHEIAPVVGEYERTSTVALNARLGPVVGRYLDNLRRRLEDAGFQGTLLVAQAYGGLLPFEEAATRPVGMIESGPVSGLVGSQNLGELVGFRNIIAADMGGTTFKVGVVREGLIEYQRESMVLRYHYALPKMDVVSLGLAGGSIVSIEPRTGTPRIGPRSAGSVPGPVCYGHGGEDPTITDVDAILGYLNPDFFLGGRASLDIDRARAVFEEKIAEPLGLPLIDAAAAMFKLANSRFHDLLHRTTVQRGLDPRKFALFSFGGTAGMHVAAYGEELGVSHIVVPHSASVHGAFGLVTSDIAHEDQITQPLRPPVDLDALRGVFGELEGRITGQLHAEGFGDGDIRLQRSIDMRYRRQVHILTVPVVADGRIDEAAVDRTIELFETLYEEKYGKESAYREAGIELVSFRVRGSGVVRRPEFRVHEVAREDASGAVVATVRAWVDRAGELQDVPGYDFERMVPGNVVPGPAVVWTPITTLVVAVGQQARVDEYKNLVIASGDGAR
ncbi:MAG: hydantoinase/oxoprolinase family protein [Thermoleophilia bacterium]|nr:hydantoinase/oxoprolinase family protein [Thermoleophilia bacterium]